MLEGMTAQAVMGTGSVMGYTGAVWHGAGANTTASEARFGLPASYILGWLRQEENQYLACPPNIAAQMPRRMQKLLGYQLSGMGLGFTGHDAGNPEE